MIKNKRLEGIREHFLIFIIIIMAMFFINFSSAELITFTTDSGWTSGTTATSCEGQNATAFKNFYLMNLTKSTSVNATTAYILFDNGTKITESNFSGNIASFNNLIISNQSLFVFCTGVNIGRAYNDSYKLINNPVSPNSFFNTTGRVDYTIATGNNWGAKTLFQGNIFINFLNIGVEENIININFPTNLSNNVVNSSTILNWTTISLNNNLTNTTLYINGVLNETISISGNSNTTTTNKIFTNLGEYNWSIKSCTATTCFNSSTYSFNISKVAINSVSYSSPIGEGLSNSYNANISSRPNISSAYINYSGTLYSASISGSNGEYILTANLIPALVSGSSNNSFNWIVILSDSYQFNSSYYYQTISDITLDNCSINSNNLYNFTIFDETLQNVINPTTSNTYVETTFSLYLNDGVTLLQNFSQAFNKTNPFRICINSNLSSIESYLLDGQVQYRATGYAVEFYNIQKENITSSDIGTNISLYDLNSSVAQEFLITYTDTNFQPVSNALILIKKKYINEGVFKTVEVPITDINGQTIANLVLSEVVYTFDVVKNGELLGTFENVVAFCDNIATGDCKINLNSYSSTSAPDSYANVDDYIFTIDYNRSTRTASTSFSVASGSVSLNTLNVTSFSGVGTTQLCYSSITTASGSLSCIIPSSYENETITISLYKDYVLMGKAIISQNTQPSNIYGSNRVFIAIISFLTLVAIGLSEGPIITGILMVIGLILLISLNMIYNSGILGGSFTIIWVIIAIILIIARSNKK